MSDEQRIRAPKVDGPETEPIVHPSLDGLIWWLEREVREGRGEMEYNYVNPDNCLICRYLKARGFKGANCDNLSYSYDGIKHDIRLPRHLNEVALDGDRIYAAALARAIRLRSEQT